MEVLQMDCSQRSCKTKNVRLSFGEERALGPQRKNIGEGFSYCRSSGSALATEWSYRLKAPPLAQDPCASRHLSFATRHIHHICLAYLEREFVVICTLHWSSSCCSFICKFQQRKVDAFSHIPLVLTYQPACASLPGFLSAVFRLGKVAGGT